MLELNSLTFNNVRCFDTSQTISFSERNKLIQVDGRNENTGGSSGAGKSTIFLALDYLLGIGDIPATVLQSRLTKDQIEVTGEFIIDGKPLTIKRSKKSGLTIDLDGDKTSGNVKLAEEKLDDIIGIPRKIFKKMVHKKQKEGGFFLDMTAKEAYDFLVEMLNLHKYIKESETISSGIKTHVQKVETLQSDIYALEESIKSVQMVLGQKTKPEVSPASFEAIEAKLRVSIDDLKERVDTLLVQKQKELDTIQAPEKKDNIEVDLTTLKGLEEQLTVYSDRLSKVSQAITETSQKIFNINNLLSKTKEIGISIQSLKDQKSHLESSTCPTCKQQWSGESAKQEIARISSQIDRLTMQALENKKEIDRLDEYKSNTTKLENIKKDLDEKIKKLQSEIGDEKVRINSVKQASENIHLQAIREYENKKNIVEIKYLNDSNEATTNLNNANHELMRIITDKQAAEKALADYTKEIESLTEIVSEKTDRIEQVNKEIQDIKQTILISEESNRLIKSYVLNTFQETLNAIGEIATEILSAIPNMQTSTVYFEGCKETKSGVLKDEISAVVSIDSANAVPIKSLSGGERTSIDLAVDLAVIDVIEAKTNKGANFFVIDEPFDGLDSVCKENYLEMLKQIDTNKKIIMVDHSSELKEMVSDIITVVKNGESSKIVV